VAIGSTCGTQGQAPTGTCDLRLEVAGNPAFRRTYTMQGPAGHREPVQITATTAKGVGVGVAGASSSIKDTKNIDDRVARGQGFGLSSAQFVRGPPVAAAAPASDATDAVPR